MKFSVFSNRWPYISWVLISGFLLSAGYLMDPYLFAYMALGAAWVSGAIVVCALIFARKKLLWAIISGLPAALSLMLLSTFNWA
jgi:hypothetical protein